VPVGLFETVTDSTYVDGVYSDRPKADFMPIMSTSNSIRGPGHRAAAERLRDRILAGGIESYREQMEKGKNAA
jgi:hypothetical protein